MTPGARAPDLAATKNPATKDGVMGDEGIEPQANQP